MRDWINIITESQHEVIEEKGKFGNMLAAAALAAGGVGIGVANSGNANAEPQYDYVDNTGELPEIIVTGMHDGPSIKSPESPKAKVQSPREEAVKLLALTMWGEARSDGLDAMRAVGHVVMNRIHSARPFGRNVKEVVWKRKAFSCWNKSDPNRDAMRHIASLPEDNLNKVRWHQAVDLARAILAGKDSDNSAGALFYHTKQIKPYWVSDVTKPVARVANHIFYRNDAKAPDA